MSGKLSDVKKGYPVAIREEAGSQRRHSSMEARESGWSKGRQEDECMRSERMEPKEFIVSETTEPIPEVRARWAWTEPAVWLDYMLEALAGGINRVEVTSRNSGRSRCTRPERTLPVLNEVTDNHQLESRMRENRTYGSEGGAVQLNAPFLPLSTRTAAIFFKIMKRLVGVLANYRWFF